MNHAELAADEIHRALRGPAWHGSSLLELIAALSADEVMQRPIPTAHNIWELVLHITSWSNITLRRLTGGQVEPFEGEDWPVPAEMTAGRWELDREAMAESHETRGPKSMIAPHRTIRPGTDDYPPYTAEYISRVPEGDIVDILSRQISETISLLHSIPESRADYKYQPEKWSIKEVVGHMGDSERVFSYRALRFSRGDTTPVEGFDENTYVANSPCARASLANLTNELEHIRRATIHLFANLDSEAMDRRGTANGLDVSVRALAFIIAGHESHHLDTLRTRYLSRRPE